MDIDKRIYFYLPDFYYKFNLNIALINLIKEHPEYFREGISIGAVYGSFPGAIWNGGRWLRGITDSENIENTVEAFNELGIPVRYTFTNSILDKNHVYDAYCNLCMKLADNSMNEVLVNSPILESYLRDKYPNFKYILSTTRCIRDVEEINEACGKYDLVVTDYRDNHNNEFIGELKDISKIELLINPYCPPTCTKRLEHYHELSERQLNFRSCMNFECPLTRISFYESLELPTVIEVDELYTDYVDKGFQHFKIEGRTLHSLDIIESYIYYMVKPEHKDLVRYKLIRSEWI